MILLPPIPLPPQHKLTDAQAHLLRLARDGKYYLTDCRRGYIRAGRKKTLAWLLDHGLLAHPSPGAKLHTLTPAGQAALNEHDKAPVQIIINTAAVIKVDVV